MAVLGDAEANQRWWARLASFDNPDSQGLEGRFTVEYRKLGRSGVKVSSLCLGMMNFRLENEAEGIATVREALDAGINFVDTANIYTRGESELVTGKALAGVRDQVVLATKVFGQMVDEDLNAQGSTRRHVKDQCEASLRRLGTDRIDLYQLHRPDGDTPIEETLQALDDLVREGKVHYVGVSTFPVWRTMEAIAVADRRNLSSSPLTEQPPYNLLDRRIEKELVPLSQEYGLGILPWSPLSSGILTGKYSHGSIPEGTRMASAHHLTSQPGFEQGVEMAGQICKVAETAGLTPVQLALAWVQQQPGVTSPIIGPRDRAQLAQNLAAADVVLDADTLAALDALVAPGTAVYALS